MKTVVTLQGPQEQEDLQERKDCRHSVRRKYTDLNMENTGFEKFTNLCRYWKMRSNITQLWEKGLNQSLYFLSVLSPKKSSGKYSKSNFVFEIFLSDRRIPTNLIFHPCKKLNNFLFLASGKVSLTFCMIASICGCGGVINTRVSFMTST